MHRAPLFELEIDPEAIIRIEPKRGSLPSDVMAIEAEQVWFVRFGR